MTLAKAKANTNETFIVQTSLTIINYDCQNMFIVQASDLIMSTSLLLYQVWNWLRANWQAIQRYFKAGLDSSLGDIISAIASDFNKEFELSELQSFYQGPML